MSALEAGRPKPPARRVPSPGTEDLATTTPREPWSDPDLPEIPDFRVVRRIAVGGSGIVYEAVDPHGRHVALKMLLTSSRQDSPEFAEFRAEAERVARFDHEHIVQVYEFGACDGRAFYTMEYAPGGTLDLKWNRRPQPPLAVAEVLEQVARAVGYAHRQTPKVVHRDLKPQNVLLSADGTPKVTDFGVACVIDQAGVLAAPGGGTPPYMAPEQAATRHGDIGPATDVWALGVMLYEGLTGRRPFLGEDWIETLQLVVSLEPVPPRQLRPEVPPDLEAVCLRCLRKAPHDRYRDARELADDLREVLDGQPVSARRRGPAHWVRDHAVITAVLGLTGVAVATFLAVQAGGNGAEAAPVPDGSTPSGARIADASHPGGSAIHTPAPVEWGPEIRPAAEEPPSLRVSFELERTLSGHENAVSDVAYSPDGRRIASASWDRTVRIWDAASGRQVLTLAGHSRPVHGVAFSPGGGLLASGAGDLSRPGEVKVWDATTGRELLSLDGHAEPVRCVAFSPDGRTLASGGRGVVNLWDLATGRQVRSLDGPAGQIRGVAFDPTGKKLAAAGTDGTVRIWEAETGRPALSFPANRGAIVSVAYSPDGRRIVLTGDAGTAAIHDAATGERLLTLDGHPGDVLSAAYSPDGMLLASSSMDRFGGEPGAVKLWDAATGVELLTLKAHSAHVSRVAFAPDSGHLASAGWDGTVKIWGRRDGNGTPRP